MHRALLLVLSLTATAVVQSQDFAYTTNSGTITITGSSCGSVACLVGAVSIPSVINGLPVVGIGDEAFFPDYGLTQVTLPDTLTFIGNGSFWGCSGLTNIVIPPGVTNIGLGAFSQCSSLVSVNIPNGVQNIESTFFECSSLTNITIPTGVINIGQSAFDSCSRLSNVTIPDSVTNIGMAAFFLCTALTNFTIGSSIANIGPEAFGLCSNLAGVFFKGNSPSGGQDGVANPVFENDSSATVYYLPGTKGWGATFGGAPTKLWNPQVLTQDASFGVQHNRFGFNITGTPDIPLVVEASTDLAARSWVALQSCTLTNGLIYFSDPQWTNYPGRFYRVRSP